MYMACFVLETWSCVISCMLYLVLRKSIIRVLNFSFNSLASLMRFLSVSVTWKDFLASTFISISTDGWRVCRQTAWSISNKVLPIYIYKNITGQVKRFFVWVIITTCSIFIGSSTRINRVYFPSSSSLQFGFWVCTREKDSQQKVLYV